MFKPFICEAYALPGYNICENISIVFLHGNYEFIQNELNFNVAQDITFFTLLYAGPLAPDPFRVQLFVCCLF